MAIEVDGEPGECGFLETKEKKKLFQGEEGDQLYQMLQSGPMQLGQRIDHWSSQGENLIVEGLRR